jgi:EmrB/QacA subfamily drug resistance transporter
MRVIPLILAVALFMENMDSTVISTSLPAIAADIGTSPIALKLALTAYLVSLAIFIPISSWFADKYGAKRVFLTAIMVFMAGSIGCAIAGSLGGFVMARFLQGMGGAMMTPVARLVLVRTTERRELVAAMAWLTVPGLIGPLIGPPLGGFITTYFSWHWIFLINIPIGLIGILMARIYLPPMEPIGVKPMDVTGFIIVALAASGIVFGLSVISLPALPPFVGGAAVMIGIVASAAYVFHARRVANPILDFSLFQDGVFRAAIVGGSMFRIGSGALPFLLPLLFQLGFGMTPFESGSLTFATALGAMVMKFVAPGLLRLAGFRNVLILAGLITACFTAGNILFTPLTPHLVILLVLLAAGFSRSMFFTSANALVFATLDDKQASQATAISATTQQVSIALGVAVAGGVLELSGLITGQATSIESFHVALIAVAIITALSVIPFLGMAPEAGNAVSGYRLQAAEEAAAVKSD